MATDKEVLDYVLAVAKSKGWNQSELAAKLGTGRATVNNWVNKHGRVPPRQLRPLSNVLGKSVDQILAAGKEVMVIRHAGDRIRFTRRSRNLEAEDVARAVGLSLDDYLEVEATGNLPPTTVFLEIVKVLGVPNPHWLVRGDPEIAGTLPAANSTARREKPLEGGKR